MWHGKCLYIIAAQKKLLSFDTRDTFGGNGGLYDFSPQGTRGGALSPPSPPRSFFLAPLSKDFTQAPDSGSH
jgi:hypothetical protein